MIDELREVLTGRVVVPGDADWDVARRAWNPQVEQRPAAVIEAAGPADVEHAVVYAAANGLKISAQASGHGATSSSDGALLVRTAALDDIWVDSDARIARVGAGVTWANLQDALDGTGLTGLPGSSGAVSIVGFCTGGGLSWFSRPYGSGAGSLRAAEIVDAVGARRWVDDSTEPELMWALRGGGGNFALVTSVEIDLHPAPQLVGGRLMFPIQEAEAVLTAWAAATETAADQVTLWSYLAHFPDLPFVPEQVRGQSFCMVDGMAPYDPAALDAALAPIRSAGAAVVDQVGPLQPGGVSRMTPEPDTPVGLDFLYLMFNEPTPELIEVLLKHAVQPIFQVQLRHLRASEEVVHPGVAAADPAARYMLLAAAIVPVPEQAGLVREALTALEEALAPWHSGELIPNMLRPGDSLQDCINESDLVKLCDLKRRVDPLGTIIGNYPLP